MSQEFRTIGQRIPIRDAAQKVTGKKQYVGDMKMPGMLYAKVLFSPVAHAKIKRIDTSKAEALPGVLAVATHLNTPQIKFNSALRFIEHKIPFTEKIFDDTVRFVGDKVAAVAAETQAIAEAAIRLIEVEYEELPIILEIEDAIKPDAYPIHEGGNIVGKAYVNAGDIDSAFSNADYIFEDNYTTQAIHHSAIETHVAIADWDMEDKLTVYSPCQNTFGYRCIFSQIFGLPYNKIRMVSPAIGGAFGGKLETTVEPIAAILSKMTRRPVKLEYNRTESICSTRVRHAANVSCKTGFMKDGTIVAMDFDIYTNTGAYASSALNVTGAMSHKVFKAYKIDNMRFTAHPVYTNTTIAGAMRGYGSPQAFFGMQRQLNKIANFLDMDIVDLQRKNMVDPDSKDPCFHAPHGNPQPKACLDKALELIDYKKALEEQKATCNDRYRIGVGVALGVHGNNCFGAHRDVSSLMVKMNEDGSCILYSGSHDMGNGNVSIQIQILSEILGISMDKIDAVQADTDACLWHLGDYASRGVYVVGAAALEVAEKVKKELQIEASHLLENQPDDVGLKNNTAYSISEPSKRVDISEVMLHCQRDSIREICCSVTHPASRGPSSYGVHIAKLQVDTQTGAVKVLEYSAVQDVGRMLNPLALEGQLQGAIHMGIGYALCEGIEYNKKGVPQTCNFKSYHVLSATEMPKIYTGFIAEGEGEPGGPFGAKSIGESPVVPVAPAIVNAISNALGCEFNQLPVKPTKILAALKKLK